MNKIVINLNPRKSNASQGLITNILAYVPLLALAIGAVFVVIVLLQVFAFQKQHALSGQQAKWAERHDDDKLIKRLKDSIAKLEKEKNLAAAVLTPDNQADRLLEDLYAALPKNIWLDDLQFKEGLLNLRGNVVRWEEDDLLSLDKFIKGLRASQYFSSRFSKVNIKQSQKANIRGVDVLRFTLECLK